MATHSMREPAGALHHVGRFIPVHRKARGADHPPLREAAPHPPYADTCPQERDSAETENPVQAAESHLTQTTKNPHRLRPGEGNGLRLRGTKTLYHKYHNNAVLEPTERTTVPDEAVMDTCLLNTDPGEVLLELEMVGSDSRRLVVAMSGTVRKVREDLDTLMAAVQDAELRLSAREITDAPSLGGV